MDESTRRELRELFIRATLFGEEYASGVAEEGSTLWRLLAALGPLHHRYPAQWKELLESIGIRQPALEARRALCSVAGVNSELFLKSS